MDALMDRVRGLQAPFHEDERREKKLESLSGLVVDLRDYQLFGIKWLVSAHETTGQDGCILGDEMGLGKTVQVMYLIEIIMLSSYVGWQYLVYKPNW